MKCNFCGSENTEDAAFCANCGAKLETEATQISNSEANTNFYAKTVDMPMKWYKFLIYFSLFASAVLNAISGVSTLTGAQYSSADVNASIVYAAFPSLKNLDVFYGIALLALAAFAIYTRQALAGYKRKGPLCLIIVYLATAVISFIYVAAASSILDANAFDTSTITSIVTSIVMAVINYIYFNNRSHLFVN